MNRFLRCFSYKKRTIRHLFVLLVTMSWANSTTAGTIVEMTTPLGNISIELFDEDAPNTVTNFLNYVTSGRYDGTVVHRSPPGFVIQGGWLSWSESQNQFLELQNDGNINNEFKISNTRGTIAMAKVGGNPDSANSQWFINVGNNTSLDSNNGGFTVFGQVIGDGMTVVDAINNLTIWRYQNILEELPLINYVNGPLLNSHLVNITMSVVDNSTPAFDPNVFNSETGQLDVTVDTGSSGILSLSFSIETTEPEVIIKALADSVVVLGESVENIATFDLQANQLLLPELIVDGEVAFRNVVFVLSNADELLFTLQSFE